MGNGILKQQIKTIKEENQFLKQTIIKMAERIANLEKNYVF